MTSEKERCAKYYSRHLRQSRAHYEFYNVLINAQSIIAFRIHSCSMFRYLFLILFETVVIAKLIRDAEAASYWKQNHERDMLREYDWHGLRRDVVNLR